MSTNSTPRDFSASLILLVFSTLLTICNADVIGVDLSGNMKQKKASLSDDDSVGLLDPVIRLNRFTFQSTIVEEHDTTGLLYSDAVPHWMVLFCPPWYEPCQAMDPLFQSLTKKWEDQLNGALLSAQVRFAAVDCATEKALCNTQNVDTYPFVAHYRNHVQVSRWRGERYDTMENRLRGYLTNELGPLATASNQKQDATTQGGLLQIWYKARDDLVEWLSTELGKSFRAPAKGLVSDASVWFSRTYRMIIAIAVFALIAVNALYLGSSAIWLLWNEASSPAASSTKAQMPMEGGFSVCDPPAAEQASCTMRSLPKEWGNDRPSLVL